VRRGGASGFVPLPKRWIVGRTFAWLGRCCRLARGFENLAVNALAFLGMIRLMLRQLARASHRS
jgi:transposase